MFKATLSQWADMFIFHSLCKLDLKKKKTKQKTIPNIPHGKISVARNLGYLWKQARLYCKRETSAAFPPSEWLCTYDAKISVMAPGGQLHYSSWTPSLFVSKLKWLQRKTLLLWPTLPLCNRLAFYDTFEMTERSSRADIFSINWETAAFISCACFVTRLCWQLLSCRQFFWRSAYL